MYTLADCRAATSAAAKLAHQAESNAMRKYWFDIQAMWERRARELERNSLARDRLDEHINAVPFDLCPDPVRWGNDQVKCHKCNRIWDNSEEKPSCT